MKIKIKHTTEEDVELTLPAYRKTAAHRTKIIDEKTAIKVYRGFQDNYFGIEKEYNVDYWIEQEESTEEEFIEWFDKAVDLLCDMITHRAINDGITSDTQSEYSHLTPGQRETLDQLSQNKLNQNK